MAENIFSAFNISSQGMSVQRMRLAAVANNIANANTTKGPNGAPYQREIVLVSENPVSTFANELDSQIELARTDKEHVPNTNLYSENSTRVIKSVSARDTSPPRLVYEPSHPDADEKGYVRYPNINVVTEMVEMISAQRAFEANANVIEAAKNIARDSLEI